MTALNLPTPSTAMIAGLGIAGSALCGALATDPKAAVLLTALLTLLLLTFLYPSGTITAALGATSLYDGIYLYYRASPRGVPVSALDLVPILLLCCAFRLRGSSSPVSSTMRRAYTLLAAGLAVGLVGGWVNHASSYDLLRVTRIEVELLIGLAAVLVAGSNPVWRRAVARGVVLAGVLAASEILITTLWLLKTGNSFWGQFAFGTIVQDATGQIQNGNVNVLRTNLVPTFVMLPALCLSAVRLHRKDIPLLALLLAASLVTLSRGYWAAMILTVCVVVAYHAAGRGAGTVGLLRMALIFALPLWVTLTFTGSLVATRIQQGGALTDASAVYRGAETRAGLAVMAHDPLAVVLGTGAGVASVRIDPGVAPGREPNPVLENQVLSRWLNLTILSVAGTALLLLGAFRHVWHLSIRSGSRAIAPMGLCLPAILLGGVIGGTLMSPQQTIVYWVLAATLLASTGPLTGDAGYSGKGQR